MLIATQKLRPKIMPYAFTIRRKWNSDFRNEDVIPVILDWIFENIGPYDKSCWQMRCAVSSIISIYFSNEEDAFAFKMRWV